MTRIIAVTNVKGGVGKTTTAVNLAAAFDERGHRVLALDLDPQGSLTLSFGFEPGKQESTLPCLMRGDPEFSPSLILKTAENVDVIPANEELRSFERILETQPARIYAVRHACKPLRKNYDYILIDCPANAGPLTGAALAAADKVVIPLTADYLAFQVARSLFRIIKEIKRHVTPGLEVAGVYLTMFDARTRHARDILSSLHSTYGGEVPLFSAVVHQSVRLKEAPACGTSILKYAPRSQASQAYRVIAQEIDEGIRVSAKSPVEEAVAEPLAEMAARPTAGIASFAAEVIPLPPQTEPAPAPRPQKRAKKAAAARPEPMAEAAVAAVAELVRDPGAVEEQARREVVPPAEPESARAMTLTAEAETRPEAAVAQEPEPASMTADPAPEPEIAEAKQADVPAAEAAVEPEAPRESPEREARINAALTATKEELRRQGEHAVEGASECLQAGDIAEAHTMFRQAIMLNPLDVRAWLGCARTADNVPERVSFAKQALKLDPSNPDARDVLMLTSTFLRRSNKERWGWGSAPVGAAAGVLAVLFLASLLVLPQLIH